MEDRGVGEAIAGLLAVDVAVCDRAGLAGVVKLAQRVRGWVDAVDVAIARRSQGVGRRGPLRVSGRGVDRLRAAFDPGDESGVGSVRGVRGRCRASSRRSPPGDVSSSHVDAVANASKGLDDAGRERLGELQDALLGFARIEPVTVFERRCRLLGKRLAGDEGES